MRSVCASALAVLRQANDQCVDLFLGHRMVAGLLAHAVKLGARGQVAGQARRIEIADAEDDFRAASMPSSPVVAPRTA